MTLPAPSPLLLIASPPHNGGKEVSRLIGLLGIGSIETSFVDSEKSRGGAGSDLAAFQRRVLSSLASGWDDPLGLSSDWLLAPPSQTAVKHLAELLRDGTAEDSSVVVYDPTTCRILPMWYQAAERRERPVSTLITVRHPLDVADSFWFRHGASRAHSLLVWLESLLSAELASRGKIRSFISCGQLLEDWRKTLSKVGADLKIVWPFEADRVAHAIETELRQVRLPERDMLRQLSQADALERFATSAWDAASMLCANAEDAAASKIFDEVRAELNNSRGVFGPLIAELRTKQKQMRDEASAAIVDREKLLAFRDTKLAEAASECLRLQRKYDAAEALATSHQAEVTELSRNLKELTREYKNAKRELDTLNGTAEREGALKAEVQILRGEVSALTSELDRIRTVLHEAERERAVTSSALEQAKASLNGVYRSTSWKIGVPLRAVGRALPEGMRISIRKFAQFGWRAMSPWRNAERRVVFEAAAREAGAMGGMSEISGSLADMPVAPEARAAVSLRPAEIQSVQVDNAQALHAANVVRDSDLFDAQAYDARSGALAQGIDPALHYVLYGEADGCRPSDEFDPQYYGERYPDIVAWGGNRLAHFIERGRAEGRFGKPVADEIVLPAGYIDPTRPTVLLLIHEASRTGAPILGWNIARTLRPSINVVSVLLRKGALLEAFADASDDIVGPFKHDIFNQPDGYRLGSRLARHYRPLYVIANSVETRVLVPGFVAEGVPVVALVHEFSGYTKPVGSLQTLYEQASAIVFPAHIVRRSSEADYAILKLRHTHVLPQGPSLVPDSDKPTGSTPKTGISASVKQQLRPAGARNSLLVVGMGFVDWRKGVDLFVAAATSLVAREPDAAVRFVWVGHGFKVSDTLDIASYLAEQVERAALGEKFAFLDAVQKVEDIYDEADVLFLSSRLDPLPNVSIDAALRGIPIVCFADASGMAEILMSNPSTRELVVPHLDAGAAAIEIGKLALDRDKLGRIGVAVSELARELFDMRKYVAALDRLGRSALPDVKHEAQDVELIIKEGSFDPELFLGDRAKTMPLEEAVRTYVAQASKLDYARVPIAGAYTRRPVAGFNPYTYAREYKGFGALGRRDPLADYLREGRPEGPWLHPVIRGGSSRARASKGTNLRVVLHGHFHYTDNVADFFKAVAANDHLCRLILTTDSVGKADEIHEVAKRYGAVADVRIVGNIGRDIAPFLAVLEEVKGQCDLLGHLHGKRSVTTQNVGTDFGDRWRKFLWEHLLGESECMMDLIIRAFSDDPALGMVFPEDPHLIGWEQNLEIATVLTQRMGMRSPLAPTLDFPVGTMFWARPEALEPILRLNLAAGEYPPEPLPVDGTILHALERLLPLIVEEAGYHFATTFVPAYTR
jgi:glycosyltransferase involved in cell wall biosynthesis